MTPATHNLTIRRGIKFGPVVFAFKQPADPPTDPPVPIDLTGWSVFAGATSINTPRLKINLSPVITDEEAGEVTIEFDDSTTASFTAGPYAWDMVLENPAGERLGPYVIGALTISNTNTPTP
jgi:hypothetical protein